ncbi:MAG: heme biosynthesis HemY N-terminal domain-containing protein, partial [Burkholderiaceae bacterium]
MRMGLMVVVLAVVAATLLRNDGVVSVFVAGWRADIALNLALLGLVVAWLVAWWLARLWRSVRLTPQRMRAWRLQQRERACYAAVLDAMALVLAQRHQRGQPAAHQALPQL